MYVIREVNEPILQFFHPNRDWHEAVCLNSETSTINCCKFDWTLLAKGIFTPKKNTQCGIIGMGAVTRYIVIVTIVKFPRTSLPRFRFFTTHKSNANNTHVISEGCLYVLLFLTLISHLAVLLRTNIVHRLHYVNNPCRRI